MEIDFLDEDTDLNSIKERSKFFSGSMNGLGPDDCVILEKRKIIIKSDNNNSDCQKFTHSVIGFLLESVDTFLDYYSSLENYQDEQNKKQLNTKLQIVGCEFRCYNSFSGEDLIIKINENKEISSNINMLKDQNFLHFRYSSILRYYRANNPLFCASFGGFARELHFMKYIKPKNLFLDDFFYIANLHPLSNELQYSLALMIPIMLNCQESSTFLSKFEHTLPLIMIYMANILPKNSDMSYVLYFYIEHHLDFYCDDLSCAIALTNHFCEINCLEKLNLFIPILKSNLWNDPRCSISLARICTKIGQYKDALGYFNILPVSVNLFSNSGHYERLSKEEQRLCKLPLCGIQSDYIDAILELYKATNESFFDIIDEFSKTHKIDTECEDIKTKDLNDIIEYTCSSASRSSSSYSDDGNLNYHNNNLSQPNHINKDSINKKNEGISDNSFDSMNEFESNNHGSNNSSKEEDEIFLFDPGVGGEPQITKEISDIPISAYFNDSISTVRHIIFHYSKLKSKRINLCQDHIGNLMIAYRMHDSSLMQRIFDITATQNTVADYFVMLKGIISGVIQPTASVMETNPNTTSRLSRGILDYARDIIKELTKLKA